MQKLFLRILKKISNFILKIRIFFSYDFELKNTNILNQQELIFIKNGISRQEGVKKLGSIESKYSELSNESNELKSEHGVIFSSISLKKKCNNILEIGTYDGKNALILSHIFPEAKICTIDLESKDPIFSNTYNRLEDKSRSKFCEKRNEILKKNKNILFKEMNSVKIKSLNEKFDLIWIDGAHGYPVVTIDILNSLEILNENGLILCDDVYTNTIKEDEFYKSNAAFKTLNFLKKNKIISYSLFFKRIDKKSNKFKSEKKYIALIKKL